MEGGRWWRGALQGGLVKAPASARGLMMDEEGKLEKKRGREGGGQIGFELETKDILSFYKCFSLASSIHTSVRHRHTDTKAAVSLG